MRNTKHITISVLAGLALLLIAGCTEFPPLTDVPNQSYGDTPIIESVSPASYSLTGTGDTITISGQNFVNDSLSNFVYFGPDTSGKFPAQVVDWSSTTLKVIPPLISGRGLQMRLDVAHAIVPAFYSPYELELAAIPWGNTTWETRPIEIACDANDNVYALLDDGKVIKIFADGSGFVQVAEGCPTGTAANEWLSMQVGSNDTLLILEKIYIYKVPVIADSVVVCDKTNMKFNSTKFADWGETFDKDKNGITFVASRKSMIMPVDKSGIPISANDITVAEANGEKFQALRVFNDYVYAATPSVLLRFPIEDANGKLGAAETVYSLSDYMSDVQITSMMIAADGDIYLGIAPLTTFTGATAPAAVLVVNSTTGKPFYPSALISPTRDMIWGSGNYAFLLRNLIYSDASNDIAKYADYKVVRVMMSKDGAQNFVRE